MLLVIITVQEEVFPEIYCWTLEECTMQALRGCGLVRRTVGAKGRAPTARRIHLSHLRQSRRAGGRRSKLRSRRGAAAWAEADRQ